MIVTTQEAKLTSRWLTFRRAIAAAITAALAVTGLLPLLGTQAASASTQVTGVSGPNPTPNVSASATAVYTVTFTTSASGSLTGGASTVTLQGFPAGTTFAAGAANYTVNGSAVAAVPTINGAGCTSQCVQITVPNSIGTSTAVTVAAANVTNPTVTSATTYTGATVFTSADTTPATIPSYQIVPAPTSVTTVTCCSYTNATLAPANGSPAPSSAGAAALYHVGFVTSNAPVGSGALAAGSGTISITAPAGTVFPSTASSYTVNGTVVAAITGGGTNAITLTTPVAVPAAGQADVAISGVTNPAQAAGLTVSVKTSADTTAAASGGGGYTITAATTTITTVVCCALSGGNASAGNPNPNGTGVVATYGVSFTTSAVGALSGGAGKIVLEFPAGFTVAGTAANYSINGVAASGAGGAVSNAVGACPAGGTCTAPLAVITIPTALNIGNSASVNIVITGDITNTATAGTYNVTAFTSADLTPVNSGSFAITSQVTAPNISVCGNADQTGFSSLYDVGFTATTGLTSGTGTVTITAPSGTVFPSAVSSYEVSNSAYAACGASGILGTGSNADIPVTTIAGGGTNAVTVTVPVTINAGGAVSIAIYGVTNPAAATYVVTNGNAATLKTSGDTAPVNLPTYTIVAATTTVSGVTASPSVSNAGSTGVTYTVTFKTSGYTQSQALGSHCPPPGGAGACDSTYNTPSGGLIYVGFNGNSAPGAPAGLAFAGGTTGAPGTQPTATDITVNGVTAATVDNGNVAGSLCQTTANTIASCLSITSPVNIFPNSTVTVVITASTNPSAAANFQLPAGTGTDQGQALGSASVAIQPLAGQSLSNFTVIGTPAGAIAAVGATATPNYVGTASQWLVNFTTGASGAFSKGTGTIVVEVTTGATGLVFPSTASNYVLDGVGASNVTVNSGCPSGWTCTSPYVTVTAPYALAAATIGNLVINGVTNPTTVEGAQTVKVATLAETAFAAGTTSAFVAVPTSITNLNGPSPNPAATGAASTWTVSFTVSSAFAAGNAQYNVVAGTTTIKLDASAGAPTTVFSAVATNYVINNVQTTINAGGGTNDITLNVPVGVNVAPGGSVTIVASAVTNPTTATGNYIKVSTTTDTLAVQSATFGVGTQGTLAFQAVGITVGAGAENAYMATSNPFPGGSSSTGNEYALTFTPSATGTLNSGSGTLTLFFPTGTTTPTAASAYSVNGVVATTVSGGGTATVTITMPVTIASTVPGHVDITGITNPGAGSYHVTASSSLDTITTSTGAGNAFSLGGAVTSVTGPTPTPSNAGATTATYTIGFTTSATGALCNGVALCGGATDTITVAAPTGTAFTATASNYVVSVAGGSPVGVVTVISGAGATTLVIDTPVAIPASTAVVLTANNVTNPATGTGLTSSVNTSKDTTPVKTPTYSIGTSVVGDGGTCTAATGVALSLPCVTVTAPGGGAAIGGETGVYTVIFYPSTTGALTAGTGTITLTGPTGTVFPSGASNYVVTPASGAGTAASTVTGGGTATVTVTTPVSITAGLTSRNSISVSNVTNAAPGSGLNLTIATSADQVAAKTGTYSLATPPAPTVTAVSPTSGASGTSITITGTNFISGATVSVGGNAATGVTVVSTTSITATVPACSGSCVVGTAQDVVVTTSSGASAKSSADQFTYTSPPTVSAVSPTSGPTAGGTKVTVTGTGFQCGGSSSCVSAVNFGTAAGTGVTVSSDTSLTVMSPAAAAGVVDITVTTTNGTSAKSSADQFTYQGPAQGFVLAGAADGKVFAYGTAQNFGDLSGKSLNASIIGITMTPDGKGYWMLAKDGGIFTFGDAQFFGSMGGKPLNAPIQAMASSPDGKGYILVGADGGIFTFGDATYHGTTYQLNPALPAGGSNSVAPINQPVVGIVETGDGGGYWLVASDGGLFTFGDAGFFGSMGGTKLAAPVVNMIPSTDGKGYLMVGTDGGVFTFGDAKFFGSEGGMGITNITGIALTPSGMGYWMSATNGTVYNFGDASSAATLGINPTGSAQPSQTDYIIDIAG